MPSMSHSNVALEGLATPAGEFHMPPTQPTVEHDSLLLSSLTYVSCDKHKFGQAAYRTRHVPLSTQLSFILRINPALKPMDR